MYRPWNCHRNDITTRKYVANSVKVFIIMLQLSISPHSTLSGYWSLTFRHMLNLVPSSYLQKSAAIWQCWKLCSTRGHTTVFSVVPCFSTLTLFVVSKKKETSVEGGTPSHRKDLRMWVFPEFSAEKCSTHSPASGKDFITEECQQIHYFSPFVPFQWWVPGLRFRFGELYLLFLPSIHPFVCMSVHPSSVSPIVRLSVCRSVCPSIDICLISHSR
jgi:hypothetical protein